MEISATQQQSTSNSQEVKQDSSSSSSAGQSAASDFSVFLKSALGGDQKTQVCEEELFSAVVEQRLQAENADAAKTFAEQKAVFMKSMAKPNGYVSMEDVTNAALKATVAAGKLDKDAAEKINGEAFTAAQLDSDATSLFDGIGGPNDNTIAVADMATALAKADEVIKKIESGELPASARSLDAPSNPSPSAIAGSAAGSAGSPPLSGSSSGGPTGTQKAKDGSGGFLWKPVSDSNGNLVVLLPKDLTGLVDRVELHSAVPASDDNKIASGKFTSVGNGDRTHWRFSKEGSEYGDNVYVVAYKSNGDTVDWLVEDGSKRTD